MQKRNILPDYICDVLRSVGARSSSSNAPLRFVIDAMPKTVNHQYKRNKDGGLRLDDSIRVFRALTAACIKRDPHLEQWRPAGVVAAVLVYQSTEWVTKEGCAARRDIDNRIKAVFDATAEVLKFDDSAQWELHAYKLPGDREAVHVFLFDLGGTVDGLVAPPFRETTHP